MHRFSARKRNRCRPHAIGCTWQVSVLVWLLEAIANRPRVLVTIIVLQTIQQDTWIDVIYGLIRDTLLNTKTAENPQGEWYRLADVYGEIRLDNLRDLQLPLVLGDTSLAYGYSWEKSIDDNFYNIVKISWMDETSGKAQTTQAADQESVNRYGNLQYYEHASDKSTDTAKLQEKAKKLLQLYNHEKETIKLSCIGDHSVRAGCSIYGSVADIGLNRRVIVKTVTHKYIPAHTMELEVIAN